MNMSFQRPSRPSIEKLVSHLSSLKKRNRLTPRIAESKHLTPYEYGSLDQMNAEYVRLLNDPENYQPPRSPGRDVEEQGFHDIVREFFRFHSGNMNRSQMINAIDSLAAGFEHMLTIHRNQKRADGRPYVFHTISVAKNSASRGLNANGIIASLLHDGTEDKGVKLYTLRRRYKRKPNDVVSGSDITAIVRGLSKPKVRNDAPFTKSGRHRRILFLKGPGGKRMVKVVWPESSFYHLPENTTRENGKSDKELRRDHRAFLVGLHLDGLIPSELPIAVSPGFLEGKKGYVSNEWTALNIKLHDTLHNCQTIIGKLATIKDATERNKMLRRFVWERSQYIDIFKHVNPALYYALPTIVQNEYEALKKIELAANQTVSKPDPLPHQQLGYDPVFPRQVPRTEVVRSVFEGLPSVTEPTVTVHYLRHRGKLSETNFEVLFPRFLMQPKKSLTGDEDIASLVRKELFLQLSPPSKRKAFRSFTSWNPTTRNWVRQVPSMLFPGDPKFFAYHVNLSHIPKELRQSMLDHAIQKTLALLGATPLNKLSNPLKKSVANQFRGLYWQVDPRQPSSVSVFLPHQTFGKNLRSLISNHLVSFKENKGYIKNFEFIAPHHPNSTFHHLRLDLDPEWLQVDSSLSSEQKRNLVSERMPFVLGKLYPSLGAPVKLIQDLEKSQLLRHLENNGNGG